MIKAWRDRQGDLWVETMPGRARIAHSERQAKRIANSGQGGTSLFTIERLHGPLTPAKVK